MAISHKNGPSKAVSHKFYLVHSWVFCLIWPKELYFIYFYFFYQPGEDPTKKIARIRNFKQDNAYDKHINWELFCLKIPRKPKTEYDKFRITL